MKEAFRANDFYMAVLIVTGVPENSFQDKVTNYSQANRIFFNGTLFNIRDKRPQCFRMVVKSSAIRKLGMGNAILSKVVGSRTV